MRKTSLLITAMLAGASLGVPFLAAAMENNNPPAPPQTQTNQPANNTNKGKTTKKPKTSNQNNSSADDFLTAYHTAYAQIYDRADYEAGIATLRAMGYDDNPDVATLIGYASRRLGRYEDAKYWYDKALAADPNHAVTWSYYGMWHAEQGNVLKAKEDLEKVRMICGDTACKEYVALKAVIDGTATY